ncbi:MAG TPA: rhodanese-like domain-containing protein [candidate division Zixibacteria bacterium]|nr:rhodanese-like domain-containing protein [candidate division Zixibacteria bacterium]
MLLRYFYDENLAQASYFVGCQERGEAIVIDPARFVDPYLELAEAEGMRIIGAAETHIHADFVSGARELADRTGAILFLSDNGNKSWKYAYTGQYKYMPLIEGRTFYAGNIQFETLFTPGHTPEHISFLMTDMAVADKPMGIFTGDFIFAGDVGRPDLLEKTAGIVDSAKKGARQMFSSLQRFRDFPDYLQIWPGHGAGSACGRDLGAIPSSTLGYEKLFNWAFKHESRNSFVKELLGGQPEPPRYFAVMKRVNRDGPALLREISPPACLPFTRLEDVLANSSPIIDTRQGGAYADGHIPGTINIPRDSSFVSWAGWFVEYERPYFLIVDPESASDVIRGFGAIGLDNCGGYFETTALKSWAEAGHELQCYNTAFPSNVAEKIRRGDATLLDVRSRAEFDEGHISGARHIMLGYLKDRLSEIPADKPIVVQCRIGIRSAIGASILRSQDFSDVSNLRGGIKAWEAAGFIVDRR